MNEAEFNVRAALEKTIDLWWVVVTMSIIGGLIGFVFHRFQPPIYESTATFTITMDFSKMAMEPMDLAKREMTQYGEDFAFNSAEGIIGSLFLKNQVLQAAQAQGMDVSLADLKREMTLERRMSIWELHVRDRDPQQAADLANTWAELSLSALNQALGHAVQMDILDNQITELEGQIGSAEGADSFEAIQTRIKNLLPKLLEEKKLSQGIISVMSFSPDEEAERGKLVLYNTGSLSLGGATVGFILSLWVTNIMRKRNHD
jgi:uncharacterized protein involved in exopolysaccharide biosynthesis